MTIVQSLEVAWLATDRTSNPLLRHMAGRFDGSLVPGIVPKAMPNVRHARLAGHRGELAVTMRRGTLSDFSAKP